MKKLFSDEWKTESHFVFFENYFDNVRANNYFQSFRISDIRMGTIIEQNYRDAGTNFNSQT